MRTPSYSILIGLIFAWLVMVACEAFGLSAVLLGYGLIGYVMTVLAGAGILLSSYEVACYLRKLWRYKRFLEAMDTENQ